MSGEILVELEGIRKTFRTRHFLKVDEETQRRQLYRKRLVYAARDVSFAVRRGEIFGLLGPNGAGKTTTVKMVSGLVRPDRGEVRVDGLSVERQRKQVLRRVGVVLEGTRTTIWPLTPLENLYYYGNLKNVTGRTLKKRAHELLDFIGLRDKKHVQVRLLSRGQKQKLAICIALIADPEVLLLDEPTTGLDVQSSRAIKDKIIEMTRQFGKSVVVTTHDMHVAQELCDRIGIIDKGKLVACKSTAALLDLFSDRTFLFRVDRLPSLDPIRALPGVMEATNELSAEGPNLVVRLEAGMEARSSALYGVVAFLQREGVLLRGVDQRQQNLEAVFLQLTSSTI